jgi:predicted Zn-dependent peptidase
LDHSTQAKPQKHRYLQEGAVQTAIRMGVPLFKRSHPDYPGLYFLNTLLGGYFGSRLMSNIREDKGYTYNINSSLDCMRYDGCWLISTETSPLYEEATRDEIRREIDDLHRSYVKPEEIKMVGNYILGVLMSMLDGPFHAAEAVKGLVSEEADLNFFSSMAELCHRITPEQLQQLSQKYLDPDQFVEVRVGPKIPE